MISSILIITCVPSVSCPYFLHASLQFNSIFSFLKCRTILIHLIGTFKKARKLCYTLKYFNKVISPEHWNQHLMELHASIIHINITRCDRCHVTCLEILVLQMIKKCFHLHYLNRSSRGNTTSYNVRSFPPVIFQTIPVALSIPISSNGDWIAFRAASLALVFPTKWGQTTEMISQNNAKLLCSRLIRKDLLDSENFSNSKKCPLI